MCTAVARVKGIAGWGSLQLVGWLVLPSLLPSMSVVACFCMLRRLCQAPMSNQRPHRCGHTTLSSRWLIRRRQQCIRRREKGLGGVDRRRQGGRRRLVEE